MISVLIAVLPPDDPVDSVGRLCVVMVAIRGAATLVIIAASTRRFLPWPS